MVAQPRRGTSFLFVVQSRAVPCFARVMALHLLWGATAAALLLLLLAATAATAGTGSDGAAAAFLVPKTAFSARHRFVFVAGVEGCGHHFWSAAFTHAASVLPELRLVAWGGQTARSEAWARCAAFAHGRGLAPEVATCVERIVARGGESGNDDPIFHTAAVAGRSNDTESANALSRAYRTGMRLFASRTGRVGDGGVGGGPEAPASSLPRGFEADRGFLSTTRGDGGSTRSSARMLSGTSSAGRGSSSSTAADWASDIAHASAGRSSHPLHRGGPTHGGGRRSGEHRPAAAGAAAARSDRGIPQHGAVARLRAAAAAGVPTAGGGRGSRAGAGGGGRYKATTRGRGEDGGGGSRIGDGDGGGGGGDGGGGRSSRRSRLATGGGRAATQGTATMGLSVIGSMMQSYPFGSEVNGTRFLPYVDVDAWAADEAGADYRILVLRRDPANMLRSDICRSHYHRNKYAHSFKSGARFPPLGFFGGDSAAAVAAYVGILRYAYVALQKQLALLDPAFAMAVDYEDLADHDDAYVQRLLAFLLPHALDPSTPADFAERFDQALRATAHVHHEYNDTAWQAQMRNGSRDPGVVAADEMVPFNCDTHVLTTPEAQELIEFINTHPLVAKSATL